MLQIKIKYLSPEGIQGPFSNFKTLLITARSLLHTNQGDQNISEDYVIALKKTSWGRGWALFIPLRVMVMCWIQNCGNMESPIGTDYQGNFGYLRWPERRKRYYSSKHFEDCTPNRPDICCSSIFLTNHLKSGKGTHEIVSSTILAILLLHDDSP